MQHGGNKSVEKGRKKKMVRKSESIEGKNWWIDRSNGDWRGEQRISPRGWRREKERRKVDKVHAAKDAQHTIRRIVKI